jgi:putative cardiolipin synthase
VQTQLLIVSPHLVPGPAGMKFLEGLRERNVNVRILTNSLASTDMSIVHSGNRAFREPLLAGGFGLYEVRAVLGQPGVRGNRLKCPSSGQFAMHAKVFAYDRR